MEALKSIIPIVVGLGILLTWSASKKYTIAIKSIVTVMPDIYDDIIKMDPSAFTIFNHYGFEYNELRDPLINDVVDKKNDGKGFTTMQLILMRNGETNI